MRKTINPGKSRRTINMHDEIVFSHVKDLKGNPLDLTMSVMVQNGNAEMRLATGRDDETDLEPKPLIVWINGGGWRGVPHNLMAAELTYLADNGYVVACIYYRSFNEGHYPDQLIDCKTAVRFLRANAETYNIDPKRVGVMGRSAGGHLSSLMAMNLPGYDTEEWGDMPSTVSACVDLFGPTDLQAAYDRSVASIPNQRAQRIEDIVEAKLLGGDMATLRDRCYDASPINHINDKMCPMLIMHGDQDAVVPYSMSENFYNKIVEMGYGDRVDFITVENGGHGTREFFQQQTRDEILSFFDRTLKVIK